MAAVAGLGLTGLGATSAQAAGPSAGTAGGFDPAAAKWHACPADFVQTVHDYYDALYPVSKIVQCAELQVPLDYAKPHGKKITLQLTKTPHTGKGRPRATSSSTRADRAAAARSSGRGCSPRTPRRCATPTTSSGSTRAVSA